MTDTVAFILFIALCFGLAYAHARSEMDVTICQAQGSTLILVPSDITVFGSSVDLSRFECKTERMSRERLWQLRSAYRRASGTR
jgi:hypothetical protein